MLGTNSLPTRHDLCGKTTENLVTSRIKARNNMTKKFGLWKHVKVCSKVRKCEQKRGKYSGLTNFFGEIW